MMTYNGKYNSGFSYAINSLLYVTKNRMISNPDCSAMRLSVYRCNNDLNEFFLPGLNWSDYIKILTDNVGITKYDLFKANMEILNNIDEEVYFLLGEVYYPEWDMTIIHKLCNSDYGFLVCKKQKNGFDVVNPLGCASMICTVEELSCLFVENHSFIFIINQCDEFVVTKKNILLEQLLYILKTSPLKIEKDYLSEILKSTKNKIRFHYRLMTYIQSRYDYYHFFSLNDIVQEKLSLIDLEDEKKLVDRINEAELYFFDSLYDVSRKGNI